ncbi:AIPR family protein [Pseudomonas aeruginosa]|uniref:AIPR family protein n=1 Tax=Pseudomonas aeruginosa TaxID=287 RepID=UPI00226D6E36|nr:AIPR family protein [Pseudomonas aeruginosa]MCY0415956.1 AIPR family protein [Pseudomonas aeruginosa]MCY0427357.1 AIPR family protein [Pseudomonas aeruginosa]HEJ4926160.1 AIPR family protein [Pseudomonas aeruginosa]HEJ6366150.1 AIPR family protein [Pseudomonas aeruginosa]HEJ6456491.1 AIPR family protein [Pseudomonas aeruginosa]
MHLVTRSYFDNFCRDFGAPYEEAKNFEAFVNYCAFSKYSGDSVEASDLVYEGADPGIDGALLFLDDRAVFSVEELEEIFKTTRREYKVTIVLTQAKRSMSWSKQEVDSFVAAVVDYLSETPAQPHSRYLSDFKDMFKKVFENIGRVVGGLPNLHVYFFSAASDTDAVEINAAFQVGEAALKKLGYSNETIFFKAHREVIHDLWLSAGGPMEARLATVGYAPFPAAPNINNAYVATVTARSFIDSILKDQNGSPRKKLFEENVRDFLGVDVEVNSEIAETLSDEEKKPRFGLMNNGVTIVASSVRPAGQEIYVRDFQIVNGCQTSNILISMDAQVDNSVSLMIKLIEADEPSVVDDIVRATNRQSKVEDAQFVSTLDSLRDLEQYFNARGAGEANRIYFERRKGQYRTENVAPVRIFDVRETARCYAALVMMRPDLSSRYPNRLTGELLSDVFAQGAPEEDYYTACYSHYRLKMLTSNKRFDGRYSKLRWHIITAASKYCGAKYREMGCGTKNEALYNLFSSNDGDWFDRLDLLVKTALPDPDISRDLLKSPPLTATVLSNLDAILD